MKRVLLIEQVERRILLIRGHKVMLNTDLALLYGVSAKRLNEQVRRNIIRFPSDFMFRLTWEESQKLSRSQFATLKRGGNIKYLPYAFTEQGVAMLSSVLNSERSIQVNIAIMRAFVKLCQLLSTHQELARHLAELERKLQGHDQQIRSIFEVIRQLMAPPARPRRRIGFHSDRS